MAFLLSRFKILDQLVTPLSIAVNAIPAFVLVSVFNNMFSTTSVVPRRLMVTLVVFFIVFVNVAKGLRQVDATHTELMRSYAASNWDMLRKVRVPNAMPYLFTALKVAAPLSVIYAYVSEYFGGAQNGLGSRIASNIANSKNAVGWAYVLGACLLGLAFYLISIAMEAVVTRAAWHNAVETARELTSRTTRPVGHRSAGGGETAMRKQRIKGTLAAVVALSFVAAACGSDDSSSSATDAAGRHRGSVRRHRGTGRYRCTGGHRRSGRRPRLPKAAPVAIAARRHR